MVERQLMRYPVSNEDRRDLLQMTLLQVVAGYRPSGRFELLHLLFGDRQRGAHAHALAAPPRARLVRGSTRGSRQPDLGSGRRG